MIVKEISYPEKKLKASVSDHKRVIIESAESVNRNFRSHTSVKGKYITI